MNRSNSTKHNANEILVMVLWNHFFLLLQHNECMKKMAAILILITMTIKVIFFIIIVIITVTIQHFHSSWICCKVFVFRKDSSFKNSYFSLFFETQDTKFFYGCIFWQNIFMFHKNCINLLIRCHMWPPSTFKLVFLEGN